MAIKRPTTTPLPDEIADWWMAELSGAELKCLIYIVRHTFGYGKNITGDAISLDQFQHGIRRKEDGAIVDRGTGLSSRSTITTALGGLVAKGLVKRTHRTSMAGDADSTMYVLDLENEEAWPRPALAAAAGAEGSTKTGPPPARGSTKSGLPPAAGSPKSGPPQAQPDPLAPDGSPKSGLQVVQKLDPQETTIQEIPGVPPVPPVDISINSDTSARTEDRRHKQLARAREESSYSVNQLDPLPGWVQQAIGAIQSKREEETISARTRALWADAVQRTLGDLSQGERDAYIGYLLSDDYIKSRSSQKAVADAVEEDYGTWKRLGRPKTKVEGFKRAPRAGMRRIPSAADIEAQEDRGPSCPQCRKIPGARHSYDCPSGFAGQVVGQERKTS